MNIYITRSTQFVIFTLNKFNEHYNWFTQLIEICSCQSSVVTAELEYWIHNWCFLITQTFNLSRVWPPSSSIAELHESRFPSRYEAEQEYYCSFHVKLSLMKGTKWYRVSIYRLLNLSNDNRDFAHHEVFFCNRTNDDPATLRLAFY